MKIKHIHINAIHKDIMANLSVMAQSCPRCWRVPRVLEEGTVRLQAEEDPTVHVDTYTIECCGFRVKSISCGFTIRTWNLHVMRERAALISYDIR